MQPPRRCHGPGTETEVRPACSVFSGTPFESPTQRGRAECHELTRWVYLRGCASATTCVHSSRLRRQARGRALALRRTLLRLRERSAREKCFAAAATNILMDLQAKRDAAWHPAGVPTTRRHSATSKSACRTANVTTGY